MTFQLTIENGAAYRTFKRQNEVRVRNLVGRALALDGDITTDREPIARELLDGARASFHPVYSHVGNVKFSIEQENPPSKETLRATWYTADAEWSAELQKVYGKKAGDARYNRELNAATPELARLHAAFTAARKAYYGEK